MNAPDDSSFRGDLAWLVALASAVFAMHCFTNHNYGFHRDELATLDDSRHLAWGYVAYPPVTPAIGRVALELFGTSLVGFRFFAALAASLTLILTGLMARELGGSRSAQILAAAASASAPTALSMGALFQYVAFDCLWWVLISYLLIRLLKRDDPRGWLAVGAVIGIGMLTKYTMGFFALAIAIAVLLTPTRRHLRSPWLWSGVGLSLLIFLPNFLWQAQHDFVSLEFLKFIHARDVANGRTDGFFIQQLYVCTSFVTPSLWLTGLYFYLRSPAGHSYRLMGWLFLIALGLFAVAQARSYYLNPAYPMLFAAGAVVWEEKLRRLPPVWRNLGRTLTWSLLLAGLALAAFITVPLAPVNSSWWRRAAKLNGDFPEQIGWPDLVAQVAKIYASQSKQGTNKVGILTGNYGEAGAINLYGPALGLPTALSGINSYYARGYGAEPPEVVILVGFSRKRAERFFAECEAAGRVTNRFGVLNEETSDEHEIFVCRRPLIPWPELWKRLRSFG